MQFRWLGLVVVGALALGACGDDDSAPTDAGTDSGTSEAGKGGGGGGGTGGTPAVTVACEEEPKCGAPEVDIAKLLGPDNKDLIDILAGMPTLAEGAGLSSEPCCTEDGDKCGVTSAMLTAGTCVEQKQEGKLDAICPDYALSLPKELVEMSPFPIAPLPAFKGCCRPDNKCGLQLDALGVGCLERTALTAFGMMGAALNPSDAGFDAGAPLEEITCVYDDTADGGADDAGN